MTRQPDSDEPVDQWTLLPDELRLVAGKPTTNRLGFALMLKFFARRGRFPRGRGEVPNAAIEYVAKQVEVAPTEFAAYERSGRTVERHRAQIREAFGFRECTVADADKLIDYLVAQVAEEERRPERVGEELLARCKAERIEPPAKTRLDRIVGSALRQAEDILFERVTTRLPPEVTARLEALVASAEGDDELDEENRGAVLAQLKADPGGVSLATLLEEIDKLETVRAIGLPANLFAGVAPRVVASWRSRAAAEAPSHLRSHPWPARVTLLAALLYAREREITDGLVELLLSTVHRINAKAEKRVVEELLRDFKRVTGKENILYRITEASLEAPDDPVRKVVYPAAGGEQTLQDLRREFHTSGSTFRQHKQRVLKASYTNHYRKGLIALLGVLEFRCSNTSHRPVIEALGLVQRYAGSVKQFYPFAERVVLDGVVREDWRELLLRTDPQGRTQVRRSVYEIAVFQALRDRLRCKEIWVVGADRWRNPDEDLPADFEEHRLEHYERLGQPLDERVFIAKVREELESELASLNKALPKLRWVEIAERPAGAIKLTPLEALPEPRNLRRLKAAIVRRWGTVPLIDMLKEAVLRTGCLRAFSSVGAREAMDRDSLEQRLILLIYAYGTNTGVRAVAAGEHGHREEDLRYARRRFLTVEAARQVAAELANATFAARQHWVWGEGSTAVASDSTHFGAFDQNIFTEWHSRYGGRGVLIYWHVERNSVAIHSQLIRCSASEVAAMVEGAIHHATDMEVEGNFVDSHGQSEIGFGITRLLGFKLLPRIKRINKVKLYLPSNEHLALYPRLTAALTRPLRWDLIGQQYDQMIKYAAGIRCGTAATEAILRRFTRNASHPTYAAMLEVGRAERSLFVARYLRDRVLQREVGDGLAVVESWNGANDTIFFGKRGEFATNQRDEQELGAICLHILQSAAVFVNTLMIQDLLAEPEYAHLLAAEEDRRGLTPLFTMHVVPYGEVKLDMRSRLALAAAPTTSAALELGQS